VIDDPAGRPGCRPLAGRICPAWPALLKRGVTPEHFPVKKMLSNQYFAGILAQISLRNLRKLDCEARYPVLWNMR
jgi:hypothetical protein